jgi:hypothetical protein
VRAIVLLLPVLGFGCADYEDLTGTWRGLYRYVEPDGRGCVDDKTFELAHTAGKFSGSGSFVLSEAIGDDENFCDADGSFDIVGGRYTGGDVTMDILFARFSEKSPATGSYTDGKLELTFVEIEDGVQIGTATITLEKQ